MSFRGLASIAMVAAKNIHAFAPAWALGPGRRPSGAAPWRRWPALGLLAAWLALPVCAQDAAQDPSRLEDVRGYQLVVQRGNWRLSLQANSLDVWRGNPPYQLMMNGHANFALAFNHPVVLDRENPQSTAQSARISYLFTCSPQRQSVMAKVTFYSTSFIPRDDTAGEQWFATWHTVRTFDDEVAPKNVSWGHIFNAAEMRAWVDAWGRIFAQACDN